MRRLERVQTIKEEAAAGGAQVRALFRHLARTSRAFYLSLVLLPRALRLPVGLAYALARTADTAADLAGEPVAERRRRIREFGALVERGRGGLAASAWSEQVARTVGEGAERELVRFLPDALGILESLEARDRERIRQVLSTILEGMLLDLEWFPGGAGSEPVGLERTEDLDRYAYHVAGSVGEFWTAMAAARIPRFARADMQKLVEAGVRFGKGLQLTNIVRDVGRDAGRGRVYLPASSLARAGLAPRDLARPENGSRLAPVALDLLEEALEHYRYGIAYTLAIRPEAWMLRVATALPLAIGIETLGLVRRDPAAVLDPGRVVKIRRRRVYRIAIEILWRARSDRALSTFFRGRLRASAFSRVAEQGWPDLSGGACDDVTGRAGRGQDGASSRRP